MTGVTLDQLPRGVENKCEDRTVGLGEIECALQGAPGGGRVAEGIAGDRLEQISLGHPAEVRHGGGAVEDRPKRRGRRAGHPGRGAASPERFVSLRGHFRSARPGPARRARFRSAARGLQHVRTHGPRARISGRPGSSLAPPPRDGPLPPDTRVRRTTWLPRRARHLSRSARYAGARITSSSSWASAWVERSSCTSSITSQSGSFWEPCWCSVSRVRALVTIDAAGDHVLERSHTKRPASSRARSAW